MFADAVRVATCQMHGILKAGRASASSADIRNVWPGRHCSWYLVYEEQHALVTATPVSRQQAIQQAAGDESAGDACPCSEQTMDDIWSSFANNAEQRALLAETSPNRVPGALLGQPPPRGGVAQLLRGHS